MPKAVTTYVCNVCKQEYGKMPEAEACEKSHYKPADITKFTYDKRKKEIPDTINVKMYDGNGKERTITYKRS